MLKSCGHKMGLIHKGAHPIVILTCFELFPAFRRKARRRTPPKGGAFVSTRVRLSFCNEGRKQTIARAGLRPLFPRGVIDTPAGR